MRKSKKRKKTRPRIPIEAVLKLKSHPVTTKKGGKGYNRKKAKKEMIETVKENL